MDKQPEALRLADELEMWTKGEPAAEELRRLHHANQDLRESVKKANAQAEHFERLWYLRGDVNEELVEALKKITALFIDTNEHHKNYETVDKAYAALAKHKEQELRSKNYEELRRLHQVNQEIVEGLKYHQEQTRPIQRTIDLLAKHKEQA